MKNYRNIYQILIISLLFLSSYQVKAQSSFCDTIPFNTIFPDTIYSCGADSIQLDAGADYINYQWNTNDTTQTIYANVTSVYIVDVVVDSTCSGGDTVFVSLVSASIVQNDTSICYGEEIFISMSSPYYSFQWNVGFYDDTIIQYPLVTTNYIVEIFNGFSYCEDSVLVIVDVAPDLSSNYLFCNIDSFVLQTNVNGNFIDYIWNTGSTDAAITVNSTGDYLVTVNSDMGCYYEDSAHVDFIIANINEADTTLCYGDSLVLSGNPGMNYYSWSTNQYTSSITVFPIDTITYYLIYPNGVGQCSDSVTINVAVPPFLDDTVLLCNESNYEINASSDYSSYIWNTGSSSDILNVTNTGTYGLTATSDACTQIYSTYINFINVDITTNDTTVCFGETISINGVSSISDYSWSTQEIGNSISPLITENITIFLNSSDGINSCLDSIQIMSYPEIIVNLDDSIFVCNQASIDIFEQIYVYPSYLWNTGETSQVLTVSSTGTYILTVTDLNACSGVGSSYVNIISTEILQNDTMLCNGNSLLLNSNSSVGNIYWNTGETTASIVVSPFVNTQYTLTATDGIGSCSDEVNVSVGDPIAINFDDTIFSCSTLEFSFDTTFSSYLWSTGQTSPSILVSTSEIISVTVTNSSGCSAYDSSFVYIINSQIEQQDTSICEGEMLLFSIDQNIGSNSFLWSDGSTDLAIFVYPQASQFYSVSISDGVGTCTDEVFVEVWEFGIETIFGATNVFQDSSEQYFINSYSGSTFEWNVSGGTFTINTDTSITVVWGQMGAGAVQIIETNSHGCISEPLVLDITIDFDFSIHENAEEQIIVFPNPFSDFTKVSIGSKFKNFKYIEIYNLYGKKLLQINNQNKSEYIIKRNKLRNGVYFMKIIGQQTLIKKIVVQ